MPDANFDPDGRRIELERPLRNLSRSFLFRGIVAAAIGVVALLWPAGSVSLLLRLVGVLILIDGALALFEDGGSRREVERISGIATILVGLALTLLPAASARLAFLLVGLWVLVRGIAYIAVWWRTPQSGPERDAARTAGMVNVVIGAVLALWPSSGLVALGWAIAIAALLVAAIMFFLASRVRSARHRLQGGAG